MTLLLLILLIGCAKGPQVTDWAETLRFHWRADLNQWEIATVGLDRFYQECAWRPSPSDDAVTIHGEKSYITDAFFIALTKACHTRKKSTLLYLMSNPFVNLVGFRETSHCIVEGYAYGMPGEEPSFTRVDYCRDIESEVQGGHLLLTSVQSWVLIPLPTSGGQQRLIYRWGHDWAHLSAKEVHVQYGQIVKG